MLTLFKKLGEGITDIFIKKKLDADTLAQLEELLISVDLGPATAARLCAEISKNRFGKEISTEEIKSALAEEIENILLPVEKPLAITAKPFVILMTGVNGAGKTTTMGKWAHQYKQSGKKVMLAAGDTFRAAAVEQLKYGGIASVAPLLRKRKVRMRRRWLMKRLSAPWRRTSTS